MFSTAASSPCVPTSRRALHRSSSGRCAPVVVAVLPKPARREMLLQSSSFLLLGSLFNFGRVDRPSSLCVLLRKLEGGWRAASQFPFPLSFFLSSLLTHALTGASSVLPARSRRVDEGKQEAPRHVSRTRLSWACALALRTASPRRKRQTTQIIVRSCWLHVFLSVFSLPLPDVPPWTYNPEDIRTRKGDAITRQRAMEELGSSDLRTSCAKNSLRSSPVKAVKTTKPDGFTPTIVKQTDDYLYVEVRFIPLMFPQIVLLTRCLSVREPHVWLRGRC